jgi:hypothetical protein
VCKPKPHVPCDQAELPPGGGLTDLGTYQGTSDEVDGRYFWVDRCWRGGTTRRGVGPARLTPTIGDRRCSPGSPSASSRLAGCARVALPAFAAVPLSARRPQKPRPTGPPRGSGAAAPRGALRAIDPCGRRAFLAALRPAPPSAAISAWPGCSSAWRSTAPRSCLTLPEHAYAARSTAGASLWAKLRHAEDAGAALTARHVPTLPVAGRTRLGMYPRSGRGCSASYRPQRLGVLRVVGPRTLRRSSPPSSRTVTWQP